ncbi:hypothetical protein Peur_034639 [Populus x canadensis]
MSGDRRESPPVTGGGNGMVLQDKKTAPVMVPSQRLRLHPNKDHTPESYEDLQLDFSPSVFRSLEKYLPPNMLSDSREEKVKFMRDILLKYLPHGERTRSIHLLKVVKERENAESERLGLSEDGSEPLKRELYSMHPVTFFVPSFMKAINDNTEESLRSIISEASPGVLTFEMLQPRFCELLVAEVNSTACFHVDDSEVTLNVCLGKQFSGGELFFRGTRCDKHVNTGSQPEEIFDYSHVPGGAVLHLGRHRHGVRATTSGHRINLLLWCRSSVFREIRKYQKDFSSWCGECTREKKGRQQAFIAATKSITSQNDYEKVPLQKDLELRHRHSVLSPVAPLTTAAPPSSETEEGEAEARATGEQK